MAVTVITHHVLRDDTAAQEWDAAMYKRLSAARSQPGWIGGQLLRAINDRMLRTMSALGKAARRRRPGTTKMPSGRPARGSTDCSRVR